MTYKTTVKQDCISYSPDSSKSQQKKQRLEAKDVLPNINRTQAAAT